MPAFRADQYNVLGGTIGAAGSLSTVIDTSGYDLHGLMVLPNGTAALVAGTISFNVGYQIDALYPLVDNTNTAVGLPFSTSGVAYSFVATQAIRPYRYVQVKTSAAQTNGAVIRIPVKL